MIKRLWKIVTGMKPDPDIKVRKIRTGHVPLLILQPKQTRDNGDNGDNRNDVPVLLWIHGGGYALGMKEMVYLSRIQNLIRNYGITVVAPGYRLSWQRPYPAALVDCYRALRFVHRNAKALGVDAKKIMVGGESAGGGLAAALCMYAHDRGEVDIAWQFPLYPMLSNLDTSTSRNNHGRVWDTRRNHMGWRLYLRKNARKKVSSYASPASRKNMKGLPPAYTFVGDGEPFFRETIDYIRALQRAGVEASMDVYHTDMHSFDLMDADSPLADEAGRRFEEQVGYALQKLDEEVLSTDNNSEKTTEDNESRSMIQQELFALQDKTYRDFQAKLIPNIDPETVIGVRTPALRTLAKRLKNEPEVAAFLEALPHKYFDENQLHAFLLSEEKDFEKCVTQVDHFLSFVDNWATSDQLSPKVFWKHTEELLPWIRKWMDSGETYRIRFGTGMLMQHYLDEQFKPEYPEAVAEIRSDEYYVNMMRAWYFATALAKQYEAVIPFLEDRRLDVWTHNKTIQKCVESRRISPERKDYLRTLKR